MRIRAALFDFDGTLAELTLNFDDMRSRARDVAADFFTTVPEHEGKPVLEWTASMAAQLRATGNGGRNGGGNGEREGKEKADELSHRIGALVLDMEMESARRGKLFDATRPMLAELARRGIATGIVTRNCEAAVLTVFPDAREVCGCLLARDHVARVKPDPAHLHEALRLLGVEPQHALMTGDHPMDVLAGQRAGTLTAAVASGNIGLDELRAAGADYTARDCAHLLELLWQNNARK